MRTRFILLLLSFLPLFSLQAQTTKEEVMSNILLTGGTYYSYPVPTKKQTPAPAGYEPFYISHYGRHGSRYMINNDSYHYTISRLELAEKMKKITPLGKDVLGKLRVAYQNAHMRSGDLSALGAAQHRSIAERMFHNYPEMFSQPVKVDAHASTVMRCVLSMSNFCQQLYAMNPKLQISMDASKHDMYYIANDRDGEEKHNAAEKNMQKEVSDFRKKAMSSPDHLMNALFSDNNFVAKNVNADKMMRYLIDIAQDMQCLPELKLSFWNLFTKEELYDAWRTKNLSWLLREGYYKGARPECLRHVALLKNILDTADSVIDSGQKVVSLRFGHDTVLVPLSYLLHLAGCDDVENDDIATFDQHWCDFRITPMAGNVQMIFYRNSSGDVLVKFLLNEQETSIPIVTDCAPYYHWKGVEAFYRAELAKLSN